MSGHCKKATERGALTSWRRQRKGQIMTQKESDRTRAITNWRRQREGQVRTREESDWARGTYILETAEGGTSQVTERKRQIERYSLSGDGKEGFNSGHGKKVIEQGRLTSWSQQRDGQVRTRKKSDQVRGTHSLEATEAGIGQDST